MTSTGTGSLALVAVAVAAAGALAVRRRSRSGPQAVDRLVEAEARRGLREIEDWLRASRRTAP